MRLAVALLAAVVLSGCFQVASVLTVRADGSATLRDDVTFSGMALLALDAADESGPGLFSRAEMETRAESLGEGVRLLSFEARDDGYTAVYDVEDVRRIVYAAPVPDEDADVADRIGLSFGFDEGDPAVLRVFVPKPPPTKPAEAPTEADSSAQALALGMARGFIGDARVTIAVEVEGDVVDTNAAAVDGSRVTLYDVPFSALLDAMEDDPTLGVGGPPSPAAVFGALPDVEGLTFAEPGTVRIRFR